MNQIIPSVSIIIPVRNEERILGNCLESIDRLDYPKDRLEVIVADSQSTDRSREIAERFGARIVPNPRQTVVSGRNRGFEIARGEFVAFTDADCIVSKDWLTSALSAFALDDKIAGVGGITCFPENATPFQKAVNVLFLLAGFAGSTAHLQTARSTRFVSDIPGCNAIYRRAAMASVMPVDEGLLTAEDVWLNWNLRCQGFKHVLAGHMVLWHHRRATPRSFFRQMYRFAIGRLQVGRRAKPLLNPLHVLIGISLPLILILSGFAVFTGHAALLAAATLAFCVASLLLGVLRTRSLRAAAWLPPVLGIFVVAWSLGFLRELQIPLKNADGK